MHTYATDSDERKHTIIYIGLVSVLLAFLLYGTFEAIHFSLPWFVESPSVLGFYGIVYELFDSWLWKSPLLRRLGLIRVPNLSGEWEGCVTSSHDKHQTQHQVHARIAQSWTQIMVTLETANSRPESVAASILTSKPGCVVLTYQYQNKPIANAVHTMHEHDGTTWLTWDTSQPDKSFEGDYYTGRGKVTFGRLTLRPRTSHI